MASTPIVQHFKYSAKYKQHPYDKSPLVLLLWESDRHSLGINLHWVGYKYRVIMIKYVQELYKRAKNKKDKRKIPRVTYEFIKKHPKLRHILKGLRKYINKRMRAKQVFDDRKVNLFLLAKPRYKANKVKGIPGYRP